MKKRYEKPALRTERFDVEDVITASAPDSQNLPVVGGDYENPIDLGGLGGTPGND